MLFNSFEFALFFIIVTSGYYLLPHRFRWFWLLLSSCVFYMVYIPVYILVLLLIIGIDYTMGIAIEDTQKPQRKRLFLLVSIFLNLGVLFVFKYYNFFVGSFLGFFPGINSKNWVLDIALPIGLSFHTLQAMSYTIEVYNGRFRAERHFGIYALYVMFYPQLVAGPIERPQSLLPQFRQRVVFNEAEVVAGLQIIAFGLFKKNVVADRLALFVDAAYGNPAGTSGAILALASWCFYLQLYFDFSAYSEIAVGTARTIGVRLMDNFNKPLYAKSATEAVNRWHVSLTSWLRSYIYNPIVGLNKSKSRVTIGVAAVFIVSGLWHGSHWTFVVWGILLGLLIVFERITGLPRAVKRLPGPVNWLGVAWMQITIALTLVAFRADSVSAMTFIYHKIATDFGSYLVMMKEVPLYLESHRIELLTFIPGVIFAIFILTIERFTSIPQRPIATPARPWLASTFYGFIILLLVLFGYSRQKTFIYFQF